jgi:hypothetical protein
VGRLEQSERQAPCPALATGASDLRFVDGLHLVLEHGNVAPCYLRFAGHADGLEDGQGLLEMLQRLGQFPIPERRSWWY